MGHRCWRPLGDRCDRYAVTAASARINFTGRKFFTAEETSMAPLVANIKTGIFNRVAR